MNKVGNLAINFMIATLLSKILGFGREISLTYIYGADVVADAYIIAMNIPLILFEIIGSALCTAFIPLYCSVEKNNGKESALKFSNNICNIFMILSIVLAILGVIFSEQLVKLFAMDFTGEKLKIASDFTKVMVFGVIFIGFSNILTCWLQIKEEFVMPALISIPYNIIIIISIFVSSKMGLKILAFGSILAMISQFIFLLPSSFKNQFRYKPYINIKDENIKKMILMIIPVFIGVGASQINVAVDKNLASTMGDGIITILNSASKLNDFIKGIFVMSVTSIIYPILSKLSSNGDMERFKEIIKNSINIVVILILPITIGTIVLAEPIVRIVFERGQFNSSATKLTSVALIFYSAGLLSYGIRMVFDKVFYAIGDTKTPMINGIIVVTMNIFLDLILMNIMGYSGLPLATSISGVIGVILLFKSLNKNMGYFYQDKIIKTMLKCMTSSVIMGIATHFTYSYLHKYLGIGVFQDIISLGISVIVGILVYAILSFVLKIEEVYSVLDTLNLKFNLKGN